MCNLKWTVWWYFKFVYIHKTTQVKMCNIFSTPEGFLMPVPLITNQPLPAVTTVLISITQSEFCLLLNFIEFESHIFTFMSGFFHSTSSFWDSCFSCISSYFIVLHGTSLHKEAKMYLSIFLLIDIWFVFSFACD